MTFIQFIGAVILTEMAIFILFCMVGFIICCIMPAAKKNREVGHIEYDRKRDGYILYNELGDVIDFNYDIDKLDLGSLAE